MSQSVSICHGPRCGDYGGRALAAELRDQGIRVEVLECQSLCPHAPIARMGEQTIHRASGPLLVEALKCGGKTA